MRKKCPFDIIILPYTPIYCYQRKESCKEIAISIAVEIIVVKKENRNFQKKK